MSESITIGAIVLIRGDNRFTSEEGIVIDTQSTKHPENGPIAVFFDRDVPRHEFDISSDEEWIGPVPTAAEQHRCARVICFQAEELEVIPEFNIRTIIKRDFGVNWHSLTQLDFPLIRGSHLCHMKECSNGLMATERTVINVWGSLLVIYTCKPCHTSWHKRRCDDFELKYPLPGKPVKTENSHIT